MAAAGNAALGHRRGSQVFAQGLQIVLCEVMVGPPPAGCAVLDHPARDVAQLYVAVLGQRLHEVEGVVGAYCQGLHEHPLGLLDERLTDQLLTQLCDLAAVFGGGVGFDVAKLRRCVTAREPATPPLSRPGAGNSVVGVHGGSRVRGEAPVERVSPLRPRSFDGGVRVWAALA